MGKKKKNLKSLEVSYIQDLMLDYSDHDLWPPNSGLWKGGFLSSLSYTLYMWKTIENLRNPNL